MNRSKTACVRCKKRKTKCSGTIPCQGCVLSKSECIYPRKPRKIQVFDTEVEALQREIALLKNQLRLESRDGDPQRIKVEMGGMDNSMDNLGSLDSRSSLDRSNVMDNNDRAGGESGNEDDVKFTIKLGSPASEVICWNLTQFITTNQTEFTISPDFNSFIEEKVYDTIIFGSDTRTNFQDVGEINSLLSQLSLDEAENYLNTVEIFINVGYLTIYPEDFKHELRTYYTDQTFNQIQPSSTINYFILKLLVIISIGQMYESSTLLGSSSFFQEPPGIKYFKRVIKYLPTSYELINFNNGNIDDILNIIELFGLISIYLRFMDKKNASVFFTLNALQLCISLNLHKDLILRKKELNQKERLFNNYNEYNNRIFWSIYCLNRFFSGRIGQPLLLTFNNINIETKFPTKDKNFKYFIELAKISEMININIYNNNNLNNKNLLNIMFDNLKSLKHWVNNLPEDLQLNITTNSKNQNDRLLSSLHCNYLHQIYLNCIPIILNFSKIAINNFKQHNATNFKIEKISYNILNLLNYTIQSCELTVHIYLKLNEKLLLRCFGFTDIDYIYANSLIFIIFIILDINSLPETHNENDKARENEINFNFISYLEICLKLLKIMSNMGNLIANAKLNQVLKLIKYLHNIGFNQFPLDLSNLFLPSLSDFMKMNSKQFFDDLNFSNDYIGIDYLQFSNDDLYFINEILNQDIFN
ncbi:hypothetical protein CLIB1444_02S11936 [[Candida] jaroonii]|uniref:Uncharacterized protein n=1 Tax=[Candida] jaroonii TaxID=467808 RepID=A0ACA9Y3N2_9ASCO|nr:hypothetical protein CLIB1444_02S11936 [[Candida] jaroonii]